MPARAPCPAGPRKGLNLGLPDSGKKARSRDARVWQQGHRVAAESLETRPCQSLASARSRPLVLMRELSPGDSLTRPFIRDDAGGDSLDVADAAHVAAPTSSVLRALLKGFIVLGKQPAETLRFKAPSVQYGFLPSEAPDAPWPSDCWTGHQKRICSRAGWRHSRLPLHACMYVHTALNLIGSMSTSVRRSSCRLLCRPTFGCNASAAQTLQASQLRLAHVQDHRLAHCGSVALSARPGRQSGAVLGTASRAVRRYPFRPAVKPSLGWAPARRARPPPAARPGPQLKWHFMSRLSRGAVCAASPSSATPTEQPCARQSRAAALLAGSTPKRVRRGQPASGTETLANA